jgi:ribosomal protein S25
MGLKSFDISNEIKTRILLGSNLGDRTSKKIIECFKYLPDDSALLIDITGSDVIDYNFCSTAIGPVFKSLHDGEFKEKYVIIKVDPDQKLNLLEGILWYVTKKRNEIDIIGSFVENGLSVKLLNASTGKLEFIGKLDELQEKILKLINEQKELTAKDIAEKTEISVEEAIKQLKFLSNNFFIYTKKPVSQEKRKDDIYCSFYNLLS